MIGNIQLNVAWVIPELFLSILIIVVLFIDFFWSKKFRSFSLIVSLLGLALNFGIILTQLFAILPGQQLLLFSDTLALDRFAIFFKLITTIGVIISVLTSLIYKPFKASNIQLGEYSIFIIAIQLGMQLMSMANHFFTIFLSLELTSICGYLLTVYQKENKTANEAALKYIVFGIVSSAVMLFGFSLLYGITGTMSLSSSALIQSISSSAPLSVVIILLLIFAGFAYKISAVPFHFWTPDVYQGAPMPVTILLSTAVKAAGFAVFMRFLIPIQIAMPYVNAFLVFVSMLTITIGNVAALKQDNIKRLLAYSGIANAGYALMGVAVFNTEGMASLLFFLLFYIISNGLAFVLGQIFSDNFNSEDITLWKGGVSQIPNITIPLVVVLISLTGLPPTVGFISKIYLFLPVFNLFQITSNPIWLTLLLVALGNTVISLFYYLRPILFLIFRKPANDSIAKYQPNFISLGLISLGTISLIFFGIYGFDAIYKFLLSCALPL